MGTVENEKQNKTNLHPSQPQSFTKRKETEEATHPQTWTVSYGKRSMTQKVGSEIQRIEPSTKEIHSQGAKLGLDFITQLNPQTKVISFI